MEKEQQEITEEIQKVVVEASTEKPERTTEEGNYMIEEASVQQSQMKQQKNKYSINIIWKLIMEQNKNMKEHIDNKIVKNLKQDLKQLEKF